MYLLKRQKSHLKSRKQHMMGISIQTIMNMVMGTVMGISIQTIMNTVMGTGHEHGHKHGHGHGHGHKDTGMDTGMIMNMPKIAKNAQQLRDTTAMAYLVLSTPNGAHSTTRD